MERLIDTTGELHTFCNEHRGWLFRGQSNPDWLLKPTLERAALRCEIARSDFERAAFIQFQRHATSFLPRLPDKTETLEWLALMQHHGAPTRLLDFTYSFWIAVYFAYEFSDSDCCVWAVDPKSLAQGAKEKYIDKFLQRNIKNGQDETDKLYFHAPYYVNERLGIQQGAFIFSLTQRHDFHDLFIKNEKKHIKIIIPKSAFKDIRQLLNDFNCNSRTLMPGIDGYSRYFQNLSVPSDLPPRRGTAFAIAYNA